MTTANATASNLSDPNVRVVRYEDIIADDYYNSRVSYVAVNEEGIAETLDDFAKRIEKESLLQFPVASETMPNGTACPKGKVFLRIGFRRYKALGILKRKDIPVTIREFPVESSAILAQWSENARRKSLTTYENAVSLRRLHDAYEKEDRVAGKEPPKGGAGQFGYANRIAQETRLTGGYVSNQLRCLGKLHPRIIDAWSDPTKKGHGVCTTNNLQKWAALPHDRQVVEFDNAAGVARTPAKTSPDGKGDGKGKGDKGKPSKLMAIKGKVLADMLSAVKRTETLPKNEKKVIIETLEFALGKRKSISGVTLAVKKEDPTDPK